MHNSTIASASFTILIRPEMHGKAPLKVAVFFSPNVGMLDSVNKTTSLSKL